MRYARNSTTGVLSSQHCPERSPAAASIHRLTIERFRGVKVLSWLPTQGVNVILGGGDAGKTTILDAIALLLSPTNNSVVADTDYFGRNEDAGFCIEAVVSLPKSSGIGQQFKANWPWVWNGRELSIPGVDADASPDGEPVYCVRVRGTDELELAYEIVQPDGTADHFSVALRRAVGLVRLSGDDRNDRDLRLVQGSALDRLLSDKGLRSRLASEVSKVTVRDELAVDAQKTLDLLDAAFRKQNLPSGLDLSVTGGQGASIASLVGLTASKASVQLPLASWGSGTRRLSALTISEQKQGDAPITVVDEVERGLEPYRQRTLIKKLQTGGSQVFLTTHSPAVLAASSTASLWYLDHAGEIGRLDGIKVAAHRKMDPETFLARLAVVAEGATEVGFVTAMLERALQTLLETHGIHVTDGGGHETTLGLLEAVGSAGMSFAGFADDEGKHPTRWAKVEQRLGALLFRWKVGDIEANVIAALPDDQLVSLIPDPAAEKTGTRLRSLSDRLDIQPKECSAIVAAAGTNLRNLLVEAASGTVPPEKTALKSQYKSHAQTWFKTKAGGRELFAKVLTLGAWPVLRPQVMPFCNAVRAVAGLPEVADLP